MGLQQGSSILPAPAPGSHSEKIFHGFQLRFPAWVSSPLHTPPVLPAPLVAFFESTKDAFTGVFNHSCLQLTQQGSETPSHHLFYLFIKTLVTNLCLRLPCPSARACPAGDTALGSTPGGLGAHVGAMPMWVQAHGHMELLLPGPPALLQPRSGKQGPGSPHLMGLQPTRQDECSCNELTRLPVGKHHRACLMALLRHPALCSLQAQPKER